jgi:hypothetical protein
MQFIQRNVDSLLANASLSDAGTYSFRWQGPDVADSVAPTATANSALDLLIAAAAALPSSSSSVSLPSSTSSPSEVTLGVGRCVDAVGATMPACVAKNVARSACAAFAVADPEAVGFDFLLNCDGSSMCNVRTNGGASSCGTDSTWVYVAGTATSVEAADGTTLTQCVVLDTRSRQQ